MKCLDFGKSVGEEAETAPKSTASASRDWSKLRAIDVGKERLDVRKKLRKIKLLNTGKMEEKKTQQYLIQKSKLKTEQEIYIGKKGVYTKEMKTDTNIDRCKKFFGWEPEKWKIVLCMWKT